MKSFSAILVLLLLAGSPASSQEGKRKCAKESGKGSCCSNGHAKPWESFNKGVVWEKTLADAKTRALKEGKPILMYQLVGDLDKEGC